MCKMLAELSNTDEQIMRDITQRLERSCGGSSVDLRLSSDIYGQTRMKQRSLGLDPADTKPKELYQALLNLAAKHDLFLSKSIGAQDGSDTDATFKAIAKFVKRAKIPKSAWVIKNSSAKKLLKQTPPKNLKKALGYRSIDSMIKHERPAALVAVARIYEPATWQHKFTDSYKKLSARDFEMKSIEVIYLQEKRWQDFGKSLSTRLHNNVLHSIEVGSVILLPLPGEVRSGTTLTSLLLVLDYINTIRAHSTRTKFRYLDVGFGKGLARDLVETTNPDVYISGQAVDWRVVHRYFGSLRKLEFPEFFEPHVQSEDMEYVDATQILTQIEPALKFWHNTSYVGLPLKNGTTISFNIFDVALNLINQIPYERCISAHVEQSVLDELYIRYIDKPSILSQVIYQLDDQPVVGFDTFNVEFAI